MGFKLGVILGEDATTAPYSATWSFELDVMISGY